VPFAPALRFAAHRISNYLVMCELRAAQYQKLTTYCCLRQADKASTLAAARSARRIAAELEARNAPAAMADVYHPEGAQSPGRLSPPVAEPAARCVLEA